jgi:hypothetical protein
MFPNAWLAALGRDLAGQFPALVICAAGPCALALGVTVSVTVTVGVAVTVTVTPLSRASIFLLAFMRRFWSLSRVTALSVMG